MSMFVSSFLPNGNYLIAADTRISKVSEGKAPVWIGDDCHKIIELDNNTFMFMSGTLNLCRLVANSLKENCNRSAVKNSLMRISRKIVSMCDKREVAEVFEASEELMAFLLVEATGHSIKTGLYLSSRDFEPIECELNPGGVIVLGAYIPGCEDGIRELVQSAGTKQEIIRAYKTAFNSQSREEVGGFLEMYEISPKDGLVNTATHRIMDSPRMSKIISESMCGMNARLHFGKNSFPGGSQFAVSESGPWHDECTDLDEYKRDKQYDGTWGKPYKFKAKDGKDGADGSDANVTYNNIKSALQRAESTQTTFITADSAGAPIIYGGKIYGSEFFGTEFNIYPSDPSSTTRDGGDLNMFVSVAGSEKHVFQLGYYWDSGAYVTFNSPASARAYWEFPNTNFYGNVDFSQANVSGVYLTFS